MSLLLVFPQLQREFITIILVHLILSLTITTTYLIDNTTIVSVSYDNGGGNVPLPVELSSFSALVNSNNVNLNWKTATEVNNNGFEVQREVRNQKSEAGSQWEKIGFVQGHGNSNSPKEYSFIDKNLTGGTEFCLQVKTDR